MNKSKILLIIAIFIGAAITLGYFLNVKNKKWIYETTGLSKEEVLFRAIGAEDVEGVKQLLAEGVSVETKKGKITPLMEAAMEGNLKIVKLLIENGADIHAKDGPKKRTPLFFAVSANFYGNRDKFETARFLIEKGADVNVQSVLEGRKSSTPLMESVLRGDLKLMKLLLDNGANVNIKNDMGDTALSKAKESDKQNSKEMVALLQQYGAR